MRTCATCSKGIELAGYALFKEINMCIFLKCMGKSRQCEAFYIREFWYCSPECDRSDYRRPDALQIIKREGNPVEEWVNKCITITNYAPCPGEKVEDDRYVVKVRSPLIV